MSLPKTILLITPCCGKGVMLVKHFQTELAIKGMIYIYSECSHFEAKSIITRNGMTLDDGFANTAWVWIDDLFFKADELKKSHFKKTLIEQLQIINKNEENEEKKEEKPCV